MEPTFELAAALAIIAGVTAILIPIVIGLVEFLKKLGLNGNGSLIASLVIGLVLGGGYYLAAFGLPTEGWQWFVLALQAIIPGISAAGTYDLSKNLTRSRS